MILINRGRVMAAYIENLGRKDGYKAKFEALVKAVDEAPAVDAELVVYGRWVKEDSLSGMWHKCSICRSGNHLHLSAYCPNCGAKMEGE
jgi:hypothetical protein